MIKHSSSNIVGSNAYSENRKLITLVPTHIARRGYDFVFLAGAGPECETCRVRTVCLTNLDVNVRYTVKQVKSAEHYCALVDSKANVVEVEKAQLRISVEKQKYIPSATIMYTKVQCDWKFCKNYIFCVDNGLVEGSKVKLGEEGGSVDCPRGFKLVFVNVSQ
ncbi:MAG: UPF0179 family protein [Thermoprotei archaeon]